MQKLLTKVSLRHLLIYIGVAVVLVGSLASFTDASSTTFRAGLQAADSSGCGNRVGTAQYTPDTSGAGWSSYAYDGGGTDVTCFKVYSDPGPASTDVRVCVQAYNNGVVYNERCTNWASAGGGWSSYSSDKDIDAARIKVENRAMPANQTLASTYLGIQLAKGTNGACNQPGVARYTSTSGGWSSWALDGSAGDADCIRVFLGATVDTAIYPTVNFSANPSVIVSGNSSTLTWSSTNATSCTGSGFSTGNATNGSRSVSPVVTTQYSVRCYSSTGHSTIKYATVTVNSPTPTATLEVRNDTTGGAYTGSNVTINEGEQISLKWNSSNATSCAGSNFSTGGATSGTQSSINEPTAGSSTVYTLICTGSGGAGNDALTVTVAALVPPSLTSPQEAEPVRRGDTATINWNLNGNNSAQCSFTGTGVPSSIGAQTGSFDITVEGESTIKLECPGGSDDVTIRVVPQVFEQ